MSHLAWLATDVGAPVTKSPILLEDVGVVAAEVAEGGGRVLVAQPAVQFDEESLLVIGHVGSGAGRQRVLSVSRRQCVGALHVLAVDVLEIALDAGQVVEDVLEICSVTNPAASIQGLANPGKGGQPQSGRVRQDADQPFDVELLTDIDQCVLNPDSRRVPTSAFDPPQVVASNDGRGRWTWPAIIGHPDDDSLHPTIEPVESERGLTPDRIRLTGLKGRGPHVPFERLTAGRAVIEPVLASFPIAVPNRSGKRLAAETAAERLLCGDQVGLIESQDPQLTRQSSR